MKSGVCLPKRLSSLFVLVLFSTSLYAATISGTVEDTTGALVAKARIQIVAADGTEVARLESDAVGRFVSPDLKPGVYRVLVSSDGFGGFQITVKVGSEAVIVAARLSPATVTEEVFVNVKSKFANTDPLYLELRTAGLGSSFHVENFTFKCDTGTFELKNGTITYLAAVHGTVSGAIFIGSGHFTLKPVTTVARGEIERRIKAEEVNEDFDEAVFRFTGVAGRPLLSGLRGEAPTPAGAGAALQHWHDLVRKRREIPLGFSEAVLHGDGMENVDAEVLASIYNPDRPGFFDAYLHGLKHKDLRFFFRLRGGAIPNIDSPEEVALVNYDPEGAEDGIWYLDHLAQEYQSGIASSTEVRNNFTPKAFKIETVIGKNDHLTSTATIKFDALINGDRVVKFQLLPNLRVTRVSDSDGRDLYFIQESRKSDSSFYVIMPAGMEVGKDYSVTVEYAGDKVVTKAGNGSYYVRARESWYPNLNAFKDRAMYDLTFRIPKNYRVITVGNLDKEWIEGDFAASHWVTPKPVFVAGFNFGAYRKIDLPAEKDGFRIEGYYLPELPDNFVRFAPPGMAPHSMTQFALEQTRAQIEVCKYYFGDDGFDHIAITEQPDFNFGQSWPNLVYLPLLAYMDSTQRWMTFGMQDSMTSFVQEVTPHEVSHQWWGHAVGWASYHDQWLSEGFAEFSAGLFVQQATGNDWRKEYTQFWERLRKLILDKNSFGTSANDAGPLWLGVRLISPKNENAYFDVTYPKGAYVLSMLRSMMYNNADRDKAFIEMMHDFVQSHQNRPASTESFKAIAEKHMAKSMDFQGNGKLDWFFNEWVYGSSIPRYKFEYQLSPATDGQTKLHMSLTQSEVDQNFAMLVPVFVDLGKGMVRIGQLPVIGNSTGTFDVMLPAQPKKVAYNAYKEILERP